MKKIIIPILLLLCLILSGCKSKNLKKYLENTDNAKSLKYTSEAINKIDGVEITRSTHTYILSKSTDKIIYYDLKTTTGEYGNYYERYVESDNINHTITTYYRYSSKDEFTVTTKELTTESFNKNYESSNYLMIRYYNFDCKYKGGYYVFFDGDKYQYREEKIKIKNKKVSNLNMVVQAFTPNAKIQRVEEKVIFEYENIVFPNIA